MKIPDNKNLIYRSLHQNTHHSVQRIFFLADLLAQWPFQLPGFGVVEVTKCQGDIMVGGIGFEIYSNSWLQGCFCETLVENV